MATAARLSVILLCVAVACGGSDGTPETMGPGSGGNSQDSGTQLPDGGPPAPDGGPPNPDGGPAPDGGPGVHRFDVNVSLGGAGAGRITSAPPGIDCPYVCAASFAENSSVSLFAAPSGGSAFAGWGGACNGTGACTVKGTASVTAAFAPPRIAVSISPATAALAAGARQQFTATVAGGADAGILWSVQEGSSGGTVDGTGLYVAPQNAGTYHVVATSHADPSRSAAATVTVTSAYPDFPPRLSMAAFDSTLPVPELTLDATGAGSSRIGQISLRGSEGTVEVDGRSLPSIVFERQPFAPPWQIIAYEVISIAPDRYYLIWLYCRPSSPDLFEVWVESTAGEGLTPESARGSCIDTVGPSNPRLRAPAVSMNWPAPIRGFSVAGADVDLPDGAPGTVQYDGVKQVVFSFVSVDCSSCGTPGWHELHSVLWNPATRAVSLGIFYLVPGINAVTLSYTLSMPVLMRGPNISYPATWSRVVPSSKPESSSLAAARAPTPLARPSPPTVERQP